jgi:hypothetical protein
MNKERAKKLAKTSWPYIETEKNDDDNHHHDTIMIMLWG